VNATVWIAASLLLGIACWTDLRKMVIPNALTVPFALGGLAYHGIASGFEGLGYAALGAAAGMLPLLAMYALRGIGGGDVKWFAAFGMWSGAGAAWQLVVWSVLFAGGIAVLLLVLRLPVFAPIAARWAPTLQRSSSERLRGRMKFPFMLAVAPAFVVIGIYG
jgi:prepilin peptidase CpaA